MADANAVIEILKGVIGQQVVQVAVLQVTIDELKLEYSDNADKESGDE